MSTLSIFVDESGDFGAHSDYYIVALIMHNQDDDLSYHLDALDQHLWSVAGLAADGAVHTGPAIRGENQYRDLPLETRKREFNRIFPFARKVPVTHRTFSFRKREHSDRIRLKEAFSRALQQFLRDNAGYFLAFDQVILYYDNGQAEITDVLHTRLNIFFGEVEFRRVAPARYRLFQVADLHCTLELLRLKLEDNRLSKSDLYFFGSRRRLQKDYLFKLGDKQL